MLELAIAQRARHDILAIYVYLAARSSVAAERTVNRLSARFHDLLAHPLLGRPRDDLRPGIRGLLIDRYIAFYRIQPGRITIVRVIDGRMNIQQEFEE